MWDIFMTICVLAGYLIGTAIGFAIIYFIAKLIVSFFTETRTIPGIIATIFAVYANVSLMKNEDDPIAHQAAVISTVIVSILAVIAVVCLILVTIENKISQKHIKNHTITEAELKEKEESDDANEN